MATILEFEGPDGKIYQFSPPGEPVQTPEQAESQRLAEQRMAGRPSNIATFNRLYYGGNLGNLPNIARHPIGAGLTFLGSGLEGAEGTLADVGLGIQRGASLRDIGQDISSTFQGQRPAQFGDIVRGAGFNEPVSALGGLAMFPGGLQSEISGAKFAGNAAMNAPRVLGGLARGAVRMGESGLGGARNLWEALQTNVSPAMAKEFGQTISSKVAEYSRNLMDTFQNDLDSFSQKFPDRRVNLRPVIDEIRQHLFGGGGQTASGTGISRAEFESILQQVPEGVEGIATRDPRVASEVNTAIRNYKTAFKKPSVLEDFIKNPELSENATASQAQEVANTFRQSKGLSQQIYGGRLSPPPTGATSVLSELRGKVLEGLSDAFPEANQLKDAYFAGKQSVRDVAPSLGGYGGRVWTNYGEKAAIPSDVVSKARGIRQPAGSIYGNPGRSASAEEILGPELYRKLGATRGVGVGGKTLAAAVIARLLFGRRGGGSYVAERAVMGQ